MVHTVLSEDIEADVPVDLRLNSDRQVEVGADNDLAQTIGLDNIAQSVVISLGNELRPLVGEPITPTKLDVVTTRVQNVLVDDVQISDVRTVDVSEINQSTNTITFEVFVGFNNSFELPVEL